jgi:glycosyltransferase involved in cell wall biosynthesis
MNTNQQKLVSVIIPAYNIEKYISQTIDSVIHQTYKNIEIIIVNDGSTDNTEKIIQKYSQKDSRIIIVNQQNGGVSAARNSGFKKASGDYFCIIDSDDIMLPEKIATQVNFLEHNKDIDFTYSKVYYFFDGSYDIYQRDLAAISGNAVYKKLLQYGNFIYTSTVLFRRSVFDDFGGFDETLRSAEEFDYWLTLASQGVKFLHQDTYLTLCRSRKGGLSSDSVTMYASAVSVIQKHASNLKVYNYQYLKNKSLLYISQLRKPKQANGSTINLSNNRNFLSIRFYINNAFVLLRKIKFFITFKKIQNKKIQDFLMSIESQKHI